MKLAPDIEIRHLSGPEWCNLLKAFGPPPRPGFERKKSDLILRVLCEERVVKFWHSKRGRLSPDDCRSDEATKTISERYDDARVVSLTTDTLTKLTSTWQFELNVDGDFLDQIMGLVSLIGRPAGLDIYPPPPWLGMPSFLRGALLNVLFPKNRCFVFLVTKDGKVWTSVIARHGARGLDLFTGSEAFYETRPTELGPAWIDDLCSLVSKEYGPVHAAVSFDWRAFWNFRRNPTKEFFTKLRQRGEALAPVWPFAWTVLHWSLDRKQQKRLGKMSKEEQKRYSDPLEDTVLEELL
ncbi:MAG: hypothetical protein P1V97_14290 [Planctomycetota bacterium]|nr:hypothetical protein [Planctomycetota bacterium]